MVSQHLRYLTFYSVELPIKFLESIYALGLYDMENTIQSNYFLRVK